MGRRERTRKAANWKQSNQRKRNTAKKRDGKRNPPRTSPARQPATSARDGVSSARTLKTHTSPSTLVVSLHATASRPPSGKVELTKDCQKQWDKQTREASSEASARVPVTVEWPGSIDLESSDAASAPVQSTAVEFDVKEVPPNQPAAAGESAQIAGAVCTMPPPANRERGMRNRESNLAKRSGYIVLTFLLFWTPLVVSVLVNLFAHRRKSTTMRIALEVEILSVSVACLTSAANPITHALVNPQFRTEFQNLRAKCNVKTLCSKP
ncbi:hypothetical protein AAFF_G00157430 [Aldrovandia affinis]|uniref:G-protein coupled receptors family 1 profile domain-containing protein n=1 Tax=Aldrovandia affinis TaxID=143900 RepID=A0AAD7RQY5_9TELE|nr:hypothetical protein AAFF_G00157430 [Aldrovandia affinis]